MRDRPGGRMSGGEQQMLTIARTLMGNPRCVLLDEPSEGLAPIIVEQMGHSIRALKSEGLSILLSEQNMHFLAGRCRSRLHHRERPHPFPPARWPRSPPTPPFVNSISRFDHVFFPRPPAHRRHRCRRHLHDLLSIDTASGAVAPGQGADHDRQPGDRLHGRLASAGVDPAALQAVVHGTTTTTNALLERKIARVGSSPPGASATCSSLAGARAQPYGLTGTFTPLIERECRLEVAERMDADGIVLTRSTRPRWRGGRRTAGAGLRGGGDPFPAQLHQSGP